MFILYRNAFYHESFIEIFWPSEKKKFNSEIYFRPILLLRPTANKLERLDEKLWNF